MNFVKTASARLLLASSLCFVPFAGFAQTAGTQPDNTKMNKKADQGFTADSQKNDSSDIKITAQIRKSLHADKTLSTYAHNVKVITAGGMVTLKGPVRSEEEKTAVEQKATEVAGAGKVTNKLTVAPGKAKS